MFHHVTMQASSSRPGIAVLCSLLIVCEVPAQPAPDIRSARSGNWSDTNVWKPAQVPRAGDRVLISPGTRVTYDVESQDVIRSVRVAGRLEFARDRNTLLNVGILRIQPGRQATVGAGVEDIHEDRSAPKREDSVLEVGTPDNPIPWDGMERRPERVSQSGRRPRRLRHDPREGCSLGDHTRIAGAMRVLRLVILIWRKRR